MNETRRAATHFASGNRAPLPEDTVELTVNSANLIVSVNPAWDAFACNNGAPHLARGTALGSSLLDAVSGKASKNFTLALLDLARRRDDEIQFEYRCDSPQVRRYMRLHLRGLQDGSVHFRHEHLHSEAFEQPVLFRTAAQRARDTTIRCSLCNHVRHEGLWKLPEFVAAQIFSGQPVPVIYGICPSCQDGLEQA